MLHSCPAQHFHCLLNLPTSLPLQCYPSFGLSSVTLSHLPHWASCLRSCPVSFNHLSPYKQSCVTTFQIWWLSFLCFSEFFHFGCQEMHLNSLTSRKKSKVLEIFIRLCKRWLSFKCIVSKYKWMQFYTEFKLFKELD